MPYNNSSGQFRPTTSTAAARRRARRRRRKRNRQIFMAVLLFSIVTIMIISFVTGRNDTDANSSSSSDSLDIESSDSSDSSSQSSSDSKVDVISNKFTVCIDPGHGFIDPGAVSTVYDDLYESDVNLSVALLLRDELEKRGFNIIMTHDSNTPPNGESNYRVSLDSRTSMANSNNVDLFISLHCNSFDSDTSVSGTRIYYYINNSNTTEAYANMLAEGVNDSLSITASVFAHTASQSYHVCREVSMPSVLVEMGFITNREDCDNFKNTDWQEKMASGLAEGIYDYYEAYGN